MVLFRPSHIMCPCLYPFPSCDGNGSGTGGISHMRVENSCGPYLSFSVQIIVIMPYSCVCIEGCGPPQIHRVVHPSYDTSPPFYPFSLLLLPLSPSMCLDIATCLMPCSTSSQYPFRVCLAHVWGVAPLFNHGVVKRWRDVLCSY